MQAPSWVPSTELKELLAEADISEPDISLRLNGKGEHLTLDTGCRTCLAPGFFCLSRRTIFFTDDVARRSLTCSTPLPRPPP